MRALHVSQMAAVRTLVSRDVVIQAVVTTSPSFTRPSPHPATVEYCMREGGLFSSTTRPFFC